jgi:hypothetical protein
VGSLLAYLVASKSFSDPRKTPYPGALSPGVACKLLWRAFPQRSTGDHDRIFNQSLKYEFAADIAAGNRGYPSKSLSGFSRFYRGGDPNVACGNARQRSLQAPPGENALLARGFRSPDKNFRCDQVGEESAHRNARGCREGSLRNQSGRWTICSQRERRPESNRDPEVR